MMYILLLGKSLRRLREPVLLHVPAAIWLAAALELQAEQVPIISANCESGSEIRS
jgi:hypothetical protein